MKSGLVCMNFIRFVEKEFEMYAATVGWRPPASVSADWSPLYADGRGRFFSVAVGDAQWMELNILAKASFSVCDKNKIE